MTYVKAFRGSSFFSVIDEINSYAEKNNVEIVSVSTLTAMDYVGQVFYSSVVFKKQEGQDVD